MAPEPPAEPEVAVVEEAPAEPEPRAREEAPPFLRVLSDLTEGLCPPASM